MNKTEYEALHSGAAFEQRPTGGVLELSDSDRVDFLQRITSNDIAALKPGQSTVTVLPSPTARVLFAFTVIAHDDTLMCLPALGQTESLSKHLRGQIFFMDKVKVTDQSEALARLRLMGPQAAALLEASVLEAKDVAGVAEAADGTVFRSAASSGKTLFVVKQTAYDIPGYELIIPAADQDAIIEQLTNAGAVQLSDNDVYTSRRVELGRPKVDHELVEDYSPLESGLAWTCAENKGCYTGQEIIARQITYDKVTKTLMGLTCDGPVKETDEVSVDGRTVGRVTSSAYSPKLDRHVALAVLKRPHNEPGTQLYIGDSGDTTAIVAALPMVV